MHCATIDILVDCRRRSCARIEDLDVRLLLVISSPRLRFIYHLDETHLLSAFEEDDDVPFMVTRIAPLPKIKTESFPEENTVGNTVS